MSVVHILAQAAIAAAPAPAAVQQQGVISYPPEFFADFQPANVAEMISRIPGFQLDSGDDVRGYEGAAGNVLIDGERPATKSEELDSILRRIPAGRVARIDLIRGGAPGIDMRGKAVIANIVRKPGGGLRGVVGLALNNTWDGRRAPSVRLEASGDQGPRRWEASVVGGGFIDDGYGDGRAVRVARDGRITPIDVDAEGDGQNVQATGAYETPILGGKVRLNGRLYTEKFKSEDNGLLLGPTPRQELSTDVVRSDDTEIGGTWTRALGQRTTLEIVGLRQTRQRAVDSGFDGDEVSDFALRRDSSETIGRTVLKHRFTERLSLEGGGEYAVNKLDSDSTFTVDGKPMTLPAGKVTVEEQRAEFFAKGVWRPTSEWTLDATLRYETSDISSDRDVVLSKTLHFVKPRFAVTWAPATSTQVRFRVEREVGQLDFNDFVADADFSNSSGVSAGNPDLNPEQAWVGEAAVEQRFWGNGSVTLTFRHFELSDVIDRGPVTAPDGKIFDRPENIGGGTKDTLMVQYSVPLERFGLKGATLRGDVTRRWSKVTDPTTLASRSISGLRPVDWSATYTQDIPSWKVTYGADAFGGWRERDYAFNRITTTKLRTFVRLFAEYRPRPDINIRVEVPNATARGLKRTVLFYPGPRNLGGAPSLDDREYSPGQMFYVRIRKTLGG